jgi:hypothetical protein
MDRPLDGDAARAALADKTLLPWTGFHILMLGLSDRPEDHALVRDRADAAARVGGGRDLDAWATALIEIDGADAVERLAADWFETRAGRWTTSAPSSPRCRSMGERATRRSAPRSSPRSARCRRAARMSADRLRRRSARWATSRRPRRSSGRCWTPPSESRFDLSEPELMAAALHANRARRAASTAALKEEAIQ